MSRAAGGFRGPLNGMLRRFGAGGRARFAPSRRRQPLLLLDAEAEGLSPEAVDVACRLVPRGGVLHVLAAVRLPLAVALEAPPGEETARMVALLKQVERLAGQRGVAVRGHVRRGRHVRAMLHAALVQYAPDVVVCFGTLPRLADLAAETGEATAVLVPQRGARE